MAVADAAAYAAVADGNCAVRPGTGAQSVAHRSNPSRRTRAATSSKGPADVPDTPVPATLAADTCRADSTDVAVGSALAAASLGDVVAVAVYRVAAVAKGMGAAVSQATAVPATNRHRLA